MGPSPEMQPKKLLFLVRDSRYFLSHRISLALEGMNNGYEVAVGCSISSLLDRSKLSKFGIQVYRIPYVDDALGSSSVPGSIFHTYKILQEFEPDIIHSITIRSILISSFLNFFKRRPLLSLFAGLGTLFRSNISYAMELPRLVIFLIIRLLFSAPHNQLVFMNEEDLQLFVKKTKVEASLCHVIKGSGVNLQTYSYRERAFDRKGISVIMASRLLKDKGVREFCEAALILATSFEDVKFVLAGDVDLHNPTSFNKDEILELCNKCYVSCIGYQSDMQKVLDEADIYCLPSYHEGLSLGLLEAAASGLAIVATDIAGSRAVITHNVEGLLVPAHDSISLANGIKILLENPEKAKLFAKNARTRVVAEFSLPKVVGQYFKLYSEMLVRTDGMMIGRNVQQR